jgi:hypothetical protein
VKKATILISAVAVLSLSVASLADAHTLRIKTSRNATFNVAKVQCERLNTCDRYGAGKCRVRNQHKVVCGAFLEGQNARGPYRCTFPVTVSIQDGSNQRYVNPGPVRCHAV